LEKPRPPSPFSVTGMCIAFDGAYILEAPPADPASTDDYRELVPEITPANAGGEGPGQPESPCVRSG
jgi:hypothetical protein